MQYLATADMSFRTLEHLVNKQGLWVICILSTLQPKHFIAPQTMDKYILDY